ncbi:MAG: TonB-dependent receptor plug domain-containing protein [Chloracidobacterium sp.]|nr:TonB-dependent receptor plug domain-containing protein [Chloracidobacterium sp.]
MVFIVYSKESWTSLYQQALMLGVMLVCAAIAASAQSSNLHGKVVDINGDLVSGASVSVLRKELSSQRREISDANGKFAFGELTTGKYLVTVTAEGFSTGRFEVNLPTSEDLLITLQPGQIAVEISVTSSLLAGSPESLFEVPGSISVIDKITLDSSRVLNFSEALRKVAGVNVRDEEGFGLRPNIGIRGTNPTRSTKVLLLEDGIPLAYAPYGDNASYYHPPIERYEAIEVLKGSSQIAFGPQTIAGVINYLTPNPTTKPSFSLALTGGESKYFNGSFTGSGTLGRTGIFAHYTRKQGDGSRENTNSRLNDVTAKIVQTIDDHNALTFKFSYYGEDSNVTYSGLTTAEYAANPRANPFRNDFFYGDRFGFSTAYTTVFSSNAALTTNAYFNRFSRDWWRQSSNSGQRPNRLNVDPDCLSMANLNTTCGNEGRLRNYDTVGIEPRFDLNYNGGSAFRGEIKTGFRLHLERQYRRQLNGDLPTSRDGVASEINYRSNFAQSGFVQHRFIFGDIAVTPGLRLERIEIYRENQLATPIALGRTTVNAVIPGIGFAYSGLPKTTIFAGVHRGFSPPRAEDIISNTGGVVDLDPEGSWNYEIGMRSTPMTGLQFEATAFRLDYENQIVAASLAGGVGSLLTNGGKTLQQGFEFSALAESGAIFRSQNNVYFRGAFTWLPTAEFRGVRYSSVTPTVLVTGNRLPYTPETLATSSVGYSHPKGLNVFVENVFIGSQFADDLNTVKPIANGQRGFITKQNYWNTTANYTVEGWKTTFFVTVKNLTDKTYIIDRSRGILPSMERSAQTGVKINF